MVTKEPFEEFRKDATKYAKKLEKSRSPEERLLGEKILAHMDDIVNFYLTNKRLMKPKELRKILQG